MFLRLRCDPDVRLSQSSKGRSWRKAVIWQLAKSSMPNRANSRIVIKPGGRVEIHLMSGGPALQGHVESISHGITDRENANGPELLANVNPTFEWVRLAQRIPVRIHIDDVPEGVLISAGMTCTVVVETSSRRWAILAALRGRESQSTK